MAGIADSDGTDAQNFLLGKVIPLRLGYVGVVNRSQEVYNDLADGCGVPQLAKKLNQILKSRISAALVSVAKEHASYGEITESKAGQGAPLLNILLKYSDAFSSMIEGKNEEMSTSELSGGARIHYIFHNIFVKSLEMDYINTSHPNFLGGSKALEMAARGSAPIPRQKVAPLPHICSTLLVVSPNHILLPQKIPNHTNLGSYNHHYMQILMAGDVILCRLFIQQRYLGLVFYMD